MVAAAGRGRWLTPACSRGPWSASWTRWLALLGRSPLTCTKKISRCKENMKKTDPEPQKRMESPFTIHSLTRVSHGSPT